MKEFYYNIQRNCAEKVFPKKEFPLVYYLIKNDFNNKTISEKYFLEVENFFRGEHYEKLAKFVHNSELLEKLEYFRLRIEKIKNSDFVPSIDDIMKIPNRFTSLQEVSFFSKG